MSQTLIETPAISGTAAYNLRQQRAHKKDSPETAKAEVDQWCEQDPVYRRIVDDIREELRHMDNRRGREEFYKPAGFQMAG